MTRRCVHVCKCARVHVCCLFERSPKGLGMLEGEIDSLLLPALTCNGVRLCVKKTSHGGAFVSSCRVQKLEEAFATRGSSRSKSQLALISTILTTLPFFQVRGCRSAGRLSCSYVRMLSRFRRGPSATIKVLPPCCLV